MTAVQNRSNFPFCGGFQPLATVPIEKLGQKTYTTTVKVEIFTAFSIVFLAGLELCLFDGQRFITRGHVPPLSIVAGESQELTSGKRKCKLPHPSLMEREEIKKIPKHQKKLFKLPKSCDK